MRHIFPFAEVNKGSRIVLYGASERGYDFYRQLISTEYCEIVLWVDKQYEWYRYLNLPVDEPASIKSCEYDLIVVSAETQNVYESIKQDLLQFGVMPEKIFWKEDCLIKGNDALKYDVERAKKEASDAYMQDPFIFFTEERLDLTIRYMYIKDILAGDASDSEALYKRLMLVQNNGMEPTENMLSAFFSDYECKKGWEGFNSSFRDLIQSMKVNGFDRYKFVPVDIEGHLINGAHRIATAAALELEAWVREYPVKIKPLVFDEKWLLSNGFTNIELEKVLDNYRKIKA